MDIIQYLEQVGTDEKVIEVVQSIIDIIADHDYHDDDIDDDTLVGFQHTVGDLRDIPGFFKDSWIVNDMVNVTIGRFVNLACKAANLDLTDPIIEVEVFAYLKLSDEMNYRIVPAIIAQNIAKYGDIVVDEEKVWEIKRRYGITKVNFN